MSHHLDTPLAARSGQLFIDDFYVFPGQDSTVFMMDVNSNITGVYAQPGFHPEARYEFKVHFDDAEYETLTYRVSFGEPNPGGRQSANVRHPGDVRLRRPQRPGTGRQRARGDNVARHRHRRALGTAAIRLRAGA
jgi:hypothetical protein